MTGVEYQLTIAGVAYAGLCLGFCLGFVVSAILHTGAAPTDTREGNLPAPGQPSQMPAQAARPPGGYQPRTHRGPVSPPPGRD